ncbi:MAG: hydroxylamine oxidoreductase, partial [Planctomycetes bacterium]|nr:hydroxylamine oxidoreductase [Planctomycetota bacterium]
MKPSPVVTGENKACVSCHMDKTPVIVAQWKDSMHSQKAVGCLDCHRAKPDEPDAFRHEGAYIATIVSPKDCSRCHEKEASQFAASHHAKAAQFVGSLDNVLGELAEGRFAAANGCWQCHGSTVQFVKDAKGEVLRHESGAPQLDPETWPNTGIGRVNLDGSKGSCTACHSRHAFSKAMARQPEVCGKCHMGPDHPQIEIFEESKHGIAFRTRIHEMNLKADKWVLGVDYDAAPTCATCHMSATRSKPVTHDVGARISWTLRPVISKKLENWKERREDMKDVCKACHAPAFVDGFYKQFDSSVEMYNDKFATPAQDIMDKLREKGKLTPTPFDEEL